MERSIAIIGAGVAGLSAGCYGRMNGYRTEIFEMHDKPGGLCTAWQRKGYTIDGCIHWLVGSRPGSGMHRVWEELGAVQGRTFVDADEFLRYEARDGKAFVLHADVDRLEEHMLEIAPEDREAIRDFCNGVRAFVRIGDMPVGKPSELMSSWEKAWLGLGMAWKYGRVMRWLRQPTTAVMAGFKSPLIRNGILSAWPGTFPAGFLLMTLAWLHTKSAGYPIGGSLGLARAIEDPVPRARRRGSLQGARGEDPRRGEPGRGRPPRGRDGAPSRLRDLGGRRALDPLRPLEGRFATTRFTATTRPSSPSPPSSSSGWASAGASPTRRRRSRASSGSFLSPCGSPIGTSSRSASIIFNQDPTLAPPGKTAVIVHDPVEPRVVGGPAQGPQALRRGEGQGGRDGDRAPGSPFPRDRRASRDARRRDAGHLRALHRELAGKLRGLDGDARDDRAADEEDPARPLELLDVRAVGRAGRRAPSGGDLRPTRDPARLPRGRSAVRHERP